jgi:hypothetical protein
VRQQQFFRAAKHFILQMEASHFGLSFYVFMEANATRPPP